MMTPKIVILNEKKLIGISLTMSLSDNKTGLLWSRFMPHRKAIQNVVSNDLLSIQKYPDRYFENFDPATTFEKWAAVEVSDFETIPDTMQPLLLEEGTYAVFDYKGSGSDNRIFEYIFGTWLPHSEYELDKRPHFEVLGEKYKNNDPDSEEEIWIPIKTKNI